jgi:alkaline phosphatase
MRAKGVSMDRRGVLALGAAATLLGVTGQSRGASGRPRRRSGGRDLPGAQARNFILLVTDGMSYGTFTLAAMMRQVKGIGPSHWQRLWSAPGVRRALCATHSADSWVTDSAAAGSAWGIGEHINNNAVNITPDGRSPEPILVTARAMGKATGLVTTTRVTHATPASFIANVPKRDMETEVAAQILDRGVDVVLGGGRKRFDVDSLASIPDLRLVQTATELRAGAESEGRLLGLFDNDHLRFTLDRPAEQPSLMDMSRVALDRLSRRPEGFVLQIEGGRVDHAAHDNDAPALIADQIEFDETVGLVAQWAMQRDDTLVIICTDHGNANPGLTIYGKDGREAFERLARAERSYEWIRAQSKDQGFDAYIRAVTEATGVALTDDQIGLLRMRIVQEQPVDPFELANGPSSVLGSILANHFGVAFLSPNHTADHVEVTAFGPGSEAMPQFIDNIDIYTMASAAMGLRAAAAR